MHLRIFLLTAALLLVIFQTVAAQRPRPVQRQFATEPLPPAQFADPDRARKLAAAFPEIERLFNDWVDRQHAPGAVMGIIIDDKLVWVKTAGMRETNNRAPVANDTVFRIASMTKSFTALAILKLRDEGKLSLDDPVEKFVPELAGLPYPTKDSSTLTIRHLLTHSEGFPEDNPWGDRQLAQSDATMRAWLRAGIPFSTAPGTAYEYSNYGFAILGQIVSRVSRRPYVDYVRDQILLPLGMSSTTFEMNAVPRDRAALGYRWEDNIWKAEPILAHGSFGAMGGLWTSAGDLARYATFMMAAFPPRDEHDRGPVRRSSVREMQQAWRSQPAGALRAGIDGALQLNVSAYGYGLRISQDCRFNHVVGHGGGLPGYGSLMRWLPDYGVGLIAMSNLTYAPFSSLFNDTLASLDKTGALQPRVVQPSPALLRAQKDVTELILKWDETLANRIAADNLFLDETAQRRATRLQELREIHGACSTADPIEAENGLRGRWRINCERGWLDVRITLAPTIPPRVQFLNVQSVLPPGNDMSNAIGSLLILTGGWNQQKAESLTSPAIGLQRLREQLETTSPWGMCRSGELLAGDGLLTNTFKLNCERGALAARLTLDPATHRLANLELAPITTAEQRCVP